MIKTHELTTIVGIAIIPTPYTIQKIAPIELRTRSLKTFSIKKDINIKTVPM